ncbi:MAG: Tat pathway signal sequence domain protein [Syntrophaceae bacterium]|nr:MAG: Tat pathway signal sequence domain protein [Syntrophaceae bacterium]
MKMAIGASATALCPCTGSVEVSQALVKVSQLTLGSQTKVFLAGVSRGAPEQDIKLAVRNAANAATDFSWLSKGDAVFIKPVNNSGNPYPATTNPTAIAAIVEILKEKGAKRVIVGDMSGVQELRFSPTLLSGSTRSLMASSGMSKAVQASGAEIHCFEESGWNAFYEDIPANGSNWKHGLMMPNILKEVQHIVLMPRCSRHILTGSSLGLKAVVGYWRHDTRLEYHRDAATLQEKTAEGNTVPTLKTKQRLVISAANKLLSTVGPDKGYVFEPENGLIIASDSVVAHDMVSLAWLLENRRIIPASEKDGFIDTSNVVSRVANHMVTSWLGGWGSAFASETITKNSLNTIWDDRILTHSYGIFGGVPAVRLEAANSAISEALKKRLDQMTAFPT